jgi:hypothetical protein
MAEETKKKTTPKSASEGMGDKLKEGTAAPEQATEEWMKSMGIGELPVSTPDMVDELNKVFASDHVTDILARIEEDRPMQKLPPYMQARIMSDAFSARREEKLSSGEGQKGSLIDKIGQFAQVVGFATGLPFLAIGGQKLSAAGQGKIAELLGPIDNEEEAWWKRFEKEGQEGGLGPSVSLKSMGNVERRISERLAKARAANKGVVPSDAYDTIVEQEIALAPYLKEDQREQLRKMEFWPDQELYERLKLDTQTEDIEDLTKKKHVSSFVDIVDANIDELEVMTPEGRRDWGAKTVTSAENRDQMSMVTANDIDEVMGEKLEGTKIFDLGSYNKMEAEQQKNTYSHMSKFWMDAIGYSAREQIREPINLELRDIAGSTVLQDVPLSTITVAELAKAINDGLLQEINQPPVVGQPGKYQTVVSLRYLPLERKPLTMAQMKAGAAANLLKNRKKESPIPVFKNNITAGRLLPFQLEQKLWAAYRNEELFDDNFREQIKLEIAKRARL